MHIDSQKMGKLQAIHKMLGFETVISHEMQGF